MDEFVAKPYAQDKRDERAVAWLRKAIAERFGTRYKLAQALRTGPGPKDHISHSHLAKVFSGERGVGRYLIDAIVENLDITFRQLRDDDPPHKYWEPLPDESRKGRRPATKADVVSRAPARRLRGAGRQGG